MTAARQPDDIAAGVVSRMVEARGGGARRPAGGPSGHRQTGAGAYEHRCAAATGIPWEVRGRYRVLTRHPSPSRRGVTKRFGFSLIAAVG
jgi:hypothetical protein